MKDAGIRSFSAALAIAATTLSAGARAADSTLHVVSATYANADISQAMLLGGKGNDQGHAVLCGADGSCTLVGDTVPTKLGAFGDSPDYLVIRLDAHGKPQWARTYGGSGPDTLDATIAAKDGGILLVGNSFSRFLDMVTYANGRDAILKLSQDGKLQWVKLMQNRRGNDYSVTRFRTAAQVADGGFILAGMHVIPPAVKGDFWSQDVAVLKLAHDGQVVWLHDYHFGQSAAATGIFVESDGRLRLVGNYYDKDNVHMHPLFISLSQDGTPLQALEYLYDGALYPSAIGEQADGKLVMSGAITVDGKPLDNRVGMLWLDRGGAPQIGREYSIDGGFALRNTEYLPDGIALVGNTGTTEVVTRLANGPAYDAIALLLDAQGNIKSATDVSTKQKNPFGFGDTQFWSAALQKDGTYRMLGGTDAFGEGDVDFLTAVWAPDKSSASFAQVTTLDVKPQALSLPSMTDDVSDVRDLPPERVDVNEIKIGDGNKQPE